MKPESITNAIGNARVFRSLSYALVFLLMACGVMSLSSLVQNAFPDWPSGILAAIWLFIVLDRILMHRQLKAVAPLSSEWAISLGAQWIVILLVARLLLSYANGLESFRSEISLIARGYLTTLFTPVYVIAILLGSAAWYATGQFLELLDEIGLDQERALRETTEPVQVEAVPAHQRLVNLIFGMGLFLVFLTALNLLNLRSMFAGPGGIPTVELRRLSGGEAGVLLYFVFGLALLSLGRLMSLQTNWNRLRIPISSSNLARQWGMYTLIFLLLLALIVSLLPAGDSLGLFPVIGSLFGFLFLVLAFLAQLIIGLVLLLLSLPFLLMGEPPPFSMQSAPPPMPVMPPAGPLIPTTPSAVWELIRSVLLWGSLVGIVVFAIIQFVRQHGGIRAALGKTRLANWLVLAWQWLFGFVDRTRGSLSHALAEGWQRVAARLERRRVLPSAGWIGLRSLDPRRRIYFFYLAMIRRGAEVGLRRNPSQTPSEYAVTLQDALPAVGDDINSITEAFVEARYSRQQVNAGRADFVKSAWGRIRSALRSVAKGRQSSGE